MTRLARARATQASAPFRVFAIGLLQKRRFRRAAGAAIIARNKRVRTRLECLNRK